MKWTWVVFQPFLSEWQITLVTLATSHHYPSRAIFTSCSLPACFYVSKEEFWIMKSMFLGDFIMGFYLLLHPSRK